MGAFVISYIVGSIIAIPFLAYHLLRTRRDLNGLRAELVVRGLIAPGSGRAHATLAAPDDDMRPLARGLDSAPAADDARRGEQSSIRSTVNDGQ